MDQPRARSTTIFCRCDPVPAVLPDSAVIAQEAAAIRRRSAAANGRLVIASLYIRVW